MILPTEWNIKIRRENNEMVETESYFWRENDAGNSE